MRWVGLILLTLAGCADLPPPDRPPPARIAIPLGHGLSLSVETAELLRSAIADARPRARWCGAVLTWGGAF